MTKKRRKIKNRQSVSRRRFNLKIALHLILAIVTIWFGAVFFLEYYMSADARYAKDNLRYIESRMEKAGLIDEKRELSRKYPSVYAINDIFEYTTAWTDAYLKAFDNKGLVPVPETSDQNPYDTYSRLTVVTYNHEIQPIYDFIIIQEAYLNPEETALHTHEGYKAWNAEYENAQTKATAALYNIEKTFFLRLTVLVTFLILDSILLLYHIFHNIFHCFSRK